MAQRAKTKDTVPLAWLAVEEVGHPAAEVARFLGISRMGVQKAVITCPPSRAQGLLRRGGRGGSELKGDQVSLGYNVPHYKFTKLPTSPIRIW